MYKIFRFFSVLVFFAVVNISIVYAANKICDEDFENVSIGVLPEINPTGSGEISRAARPFWGTALSGNLGGVYSDIGNPGKAARAHVGPYTNNYSYSESKWRFDNKVGGSREIYYKFDLRIDPNLGTSNATREVYNFKLFLITDYSNASSGVFSDGIGRIQVNFEPSSSSYSVYSPCAGDTSWNSREYYFTNSTTKTANKMMDNQWHTYEIFVDIGVHVSTDPDSNGRLYDDPNNDGIIRIWEDGILILEDEKVPFRFSEGFFTEINSAAFIRHAKSLGAPVSGMDGYIYFDNIEVWDGMPDSGDDNPPGDVTNFIAQAGDGQVALSWTNPTDSDFKGTMIRYSTEDDPYPATHNDGTFVCDSEANPGSRDSFPVPDLDNGTKYNFSAFTYDETGNYSEPMHISAVPSADIYTTPPGDVTDLTIQAGDGLVVLEWTNPTDSDFKGTMIRYRTDGIYPANNSDGIEVCNKTTLPGASDTYTLTGLSNGTTYYFSAFTYDEDGNYSNAAHISATPSKADSDTTPPGDVTNFAVQTGDSQVILNWTNPTDSDFTGTMIRYRTDGIYPVDYDDGVEVCNKTANPGYNDTYTLTGRFGK